MEEEEERLEWDDKRKSAACKQRWTMKERVFRRACVDGVGGCVLCPFQVFGGWETKQCRGQSRGHLWLLGLGLGGQLVRTRWATSLPS